MDYAAARIKMVDNQIRTTDVTDHAILRAFLTVPREVFVPDARKVLAFIDEDVPLGGGRYVMEPSPFGKLVQLAAVRPTDSVLVVGTGTGYSAAVLSHLARAVVALESDAGLAARAREALAEVGADNATVVEGPLEAGAADRGPFDVILFDGAVEVLPPAFAAQLAPGGRMVVVEGLGNAALAKLYLKEEGGVVSDRIAFNCAVKPLPGFRKAAAFVF